MTGFAPQKRHRHAQFDLAASPRQFPCEHTAGRGGLEAPGLPRSATGLDHRRVLGEHDQLVAVQEPQEPALIDPGIGPVAVGAE
jgi:hypothetical protein